MQLDQLNNNKLKVLSQYPKDIKREANLKVDQLSMIEVIKSDFNDVNLLCQLAKKRPDARSISGYQVG